MCDVSDEGERDRDGGDKLGGAGELRDDRIDGGGEERVLLRLLPGGAECGERTAETDTARVQILLLPMVERARVPDESSVPDDAVLRGLLREVGEELRDQAG